MTIYQPQEPIRQQTASALRITRLLAARQQNMLKIQRLRETLEAAQQKEAQFRIAQQQQQQHQHQQR